MSQIEQLREQIDACRPGSSDLALPALAALAEAARCDRAVADELALTQQWDRTIAAALHDAPLPEGLHERLLSAAENDLRDAEVSLPNIGGASAARRHQRIRRRWLLAGGSLAMVLALGFALFPGLRPQRTVKEHELAVAVQAWLAKIHPTWQPLAGGRYPPGFPQDVAVKAVPQRWQPLKASGADWSANVAAIDIAPMGRSRALIFVVRSSARFSVPTLPVATKDLGLSRGTKAIAWQRTGSQLLYVLAVDEDGSQSLSDYLQPQRVAGYRLRNPGKSL